MASLRSIALCLALPLAAQAQPAASQTSRPAAPPNILLIVADDLGYADIGVHGCSDIPTPHIDSIAHRGVRFAQAYVVAPYCAPSRAGLLTGRYPQRFGFEHNPGDEDDRPRDFGLPASEKTLAQRLQWAGYRTGLVGKWHLGHESEFHPLRRGFDEFFGFLDSSRSYFPGPAPDARDPILRGDKPVQEGEYLTDAFAREACSFIELQRDRPFFLYLPFSAAHAPLEAVPRYQERFAAIPDRRRRTYASMLAALDDAIGRVLETVRSRGIEERTLILFLNDNGGPTRQSGCRNDPLRGRKGEVLEGGVRVAFLAQWPKQISAGSVYSEPVSALDIAPTVLAAAGIDAAADESLEGVNLLPFVKGERAGPPHEALFWRIGEQTAVRMGDWKLIVNAGYPPALFNVVDDPGEKQNLVAAHGRKVRELREAYDKWNAKNVPAKWELKVRSSYDPARLVERP